MLATLSKLITLAPIWVGYFTLVQVHANQTHDPEALTKTKPARLLSLGTLVWVSLAILKATISLP